MDKLVFALPEQILFQWADQHDTGVGNRKNSFPDRNRIHDLPAGALSTELRELMESKVPSLKFTIFIHLSNLLLLWAFYDVIFFIYIYFFNILNNLVIVNY